jgi:hypothetical protein
MQLEEVAPMEIYTIQRPSLLAPACALSAAAIPPVHEYVGMADARWAPLSRAYQVRTQAELVKALVPSGSGNGTTGFVGTKRISVTDGGSGVPPRGRPV